MQQTATEDRLIHFLKPNGWVPNRRYKLSMVGANQLMADMMENVDLKQDETSQW